MDNLINCLRNCDVFAHTIGVSYGKREKSYGTGCGGILSLLMTTFLAISLYGKLSEVIQYKNPFVSMNQGELDLREHENRTMGELSFAPYVKIQSSNLENLEAVLKFN